MSKAEDIARWAALADAATPGPWEQAHQIGERRFVVTLTVRELAEEVGYAVSEKDAPFIAESRTAVPVLCADVTALREVLISAVRDLEKGLAPGREWLAAAKKLLGED